MGKVEARSKRVLAVLSADTWSVAKVGYQVGTAFLRYRTPVLGPTGVRGYHRVLRILWAYAKEGSGRMPSKAVWAAMKQFEDRLCPALEHDAHAFLAVVLTFDGARQWVYYTSDVQECGRRLEEMPQNSKRYPVELDAFDDPEWKYLRKLLAPLEAVRRKRPPRRILPSLSGAVLGRG
jgi:hypothetical protein